MIAKIAILFTGFVVAAGLTPIYFMACTFVTVLLLGIGDSVLISFLYPVCVVAGFITSFFLLRGAWSTPPLTKYVSRKNAKSPGESESQPSDPP